MSSRQTIETPQFYISPEKWKPHSEERVPYGELPENLRKEAVKKYGLDLSEMEGRDYPGKGRRRTWPYPGVKASCLWCGELFVLDSCQREKVRRMKAVGFACSLEHQNAWHRSSFNAEIGRRSAAKISATKRAQAVAEGRNKGYVKLHGRHEHRVVAEIKHGRRLSSGEIVHHRDENPRNNHPDNLEIMTQAEHARLHMTRK